MQSLRDGDVNISVSVGTGIDCVYLIDHFLGARDRLQNNHNHEFSDKLINQLFQEQQLSNLRRNTIPPLAIIFAITWSVGYWWRRSGY